MLSVLLLTSRILPLLLLKILLNVHIGIAEVTTRQSCGHGYGLCMPPGALGQEVPDFKAHLTDLYLTLLETVKPQDVPAESPVTDGTEGRLMILPSRDLAEAICCETVDTRAHMKLH